MSVRRDIRAKLPSLASSFRAATLKDSMPSKDYVGVFIVLLSVLSFDRIETMVIGSMAIEKGGHICAIHDKCCVYGRIHLGAASV